MLRQALRQNPARKQVSRSVSVPAPVGGWNTLNALPDMPPEDAVILDNWFPNTNGVSLRNGSSSWATGMSGTAETLMRYGAIGSTQKLFAASGSRIYDVTSTGVVGAAVQSGLTNARWQYTQIGTAAGDFLIAVNGADAPRNYNGAAWAVVPAITGVTPANLIHVNLWKQRLFFVEANTLNAWYLAVQSIGGAATKLDFSALFQRGGVLQAIGTWTIDGGGGVDDLIVFLSSEGEVAVFQGTDPSNATLWNLVGVYYVGKPIGRRCFVKWAGDLAVITHQGFIPLSQALGSYEINTVKINISNKIYPTMVSSASLYGANFGWQPLIYPLGTMIILNVPVAEDGQSYQYVMNTQTQAWCRFVGWNATCWELYNDQPYFCSGSAVYKAWTGTSDAGINIAADVKQAFSYFGLPGMRKKFNLVRPILSINGTLGPAIAVNIDFEERVPSGTSTFTAVTGAIWDVDHWDSALWAAPTTINKNWLSAEGEGYAAALRMQVTSNMLACQWYSTDWIFEPGNMFG